MVNITYCGVFGLWSVSIGDVTIAVKMMDTSLLVAGIAQVVEVGFLFS